MKRNVVNLRIIIRIENLRVLTKVRDLMIPHSNKIKYIQYNEVAFTWNL